MSMPARQRPLAANLTDLLTGFADAPPIAVYGVRSDSRKIAEGDLFLACAGEQSHGIDYLEQALAAGAVAVAYEPGLPYVPVADTSVPLIPVENLRSRVGEIANRFFGDPSNALRIAGVTGTNGKTTVAWLLAQCYEKSGFSCGYIGTLGAGLGSIETREGLTTPAADELHGLLAGFRDSGAACAAIEVSSHALAQHRINGVTFHSLLLTNLSRDHLDYHGSMRNYAASKARLFTDFQTTHRIINVDTDFGAELADRFGRDAISVSTQLTRTDSKMRHVHAVGTASGPDGMRVAVRSSWGERDFVLPLVGGFNVANAALVLAQLLADDVELGDACDVLALTSAPPGRMQRVPSAQAAPAVYVDYAHTPAGLDGALVALRNHCRGSLWCVFGCGGDRDEGKRPLMGRIAERLADRVVVTSDNPRSEVPQRIIDDIIAGFLVPENATVIEDRAAAIGWALREATGGDMVLIAGKGHEAHQIIGDVRRPFSDFEVAKQSLAALHGAPGVAR